MGIENLNCGHLGFCPIYNKVTPLDEDDFCYLLKKSLLKSPSLLYLAGSWLLLSSSSGRGRGRERTKVKELVVRLLSCESLVGVMH